VELRIQQGEYLCRTKTVSTKRTQWAERHVEEFLGLPLVREFVLRSPQTIDGTQKEVADHLILHGGGGILMSQKCQEDPASRDETRTGLWARKNAKGAARQLVGALRAGPRAIWCDHPRRGRVEFPAGLPPITHGIVLTEVFQPVDLNPDAADLPLSCDGVPITYMSVNDFLNLAVELRTVPELIAYLDARRSLPIPDQRRIGSERPLFEFYLLEDGSLQGCAGISDAVVAVAAQEDRLREALARKKESDVYSGLFEHVADALATRAPDFAEDLTPEWSALFDQGPQLSNYLQLQEIIAGLRLRERAMLGKAFDETSKAVAGKAEAFVYRAMHFDARDEVFVVGASRNIGRPELYKRMETLMRAAMTAYGKTRCFIVIDRDSAGYEVGLSRPGFSPTLTDYELAERLFGRLKMTSGTVGLVP
jgi:hypothetical protein